jgi:hypothetical protein
MDENEKMNELYLLLGQITYSYTRIDYLISYMAFDLGFVESPITYFVKSKFEKKINAFNDTIKKQIQDRELHNEVVTWTTKLQELREIRNNLIHSVILANVENSNELNFSNYRISKDGKIESDSNTYTFEDLKKLSQSYIDSHNNGYLLWRRLKNHIDKQKVANNV